MSNGWPAAHKPGTIYIAGPMRGHAEFNFPAFNAAASWLTSHGWTVGNPAAWDDPQEVGDNPTGDMEAAVQKGFSLRAALARDMKFIAEEADAIYMLHGWEASAGARAEHALASALGLAIYYQRVA